MFNKKYLSIGETSVLLGVSVSTLRRWESDNKLKPSYRTLGNHRRYELAVVLNLNQSSKTRPIKKNICYARVSGHDQKQDLQRQEYRLKKHCVDNDISYQLISDLGSGMNYNKRGLKKLILLLLSGQIQRLILVHKDRLLRFGSELIFSLCEVYGTEVIIIEEEKKLSFEQELVASFIEIITVFSAKLYGRRSHKNKKACLA